MTAPYSPVFGDEWERDGPDISMVDLGQDDTEHDLSERQTLSHARNSSYSQPDERSSRQLLRNGSTTSTDPPTYYEDSPTEYTSQLSPDVVEVKSGLREGEGLRRRLGLSNTFPKLWHKASFTASQRTTSTFDGHFAHGKPGWWKKQMLVDRSLRTMAAFTALCALIMCIIVFTYLKDFMTRLNKNSTSVGGSHGESCHNMESRNIAVHFFINIAATLILGCSNTYQQLVTALKVSEMRWMLSKRGDSKVGTNSPWSINHKQQGKKRAWAAWILLISTSIPVHFLANSIIGPSFYVSMPTSIAYEQSSDNATFKATVYSGYSDSTEYYQEPYDSACWTAFRSGSYALPSDLDVLSRSWNAETLGNFTTFASVEVQYQNASCSRFINQTTTILALNEYNHTAVSLGHSKIYGVGDRGECLLGENVKCVLKDQQTRQCRLNVRMQAAFILMGCLLIKAAYMIIINYNARGRTKEQCLTYGDVIVASVLDPELKIHNECLLNSGDGYRLQVQHTCHKHCKDPTPSATGDDIGHCQNCKKFNIVNMASDLPHPSIAIKYKRSLLSNLGSTAVTQMIILMICSLVMLGISIMLATLIGVAAQKYNSSCNNPNLLAWDSTWAATCEKGLVAYLKSAYGTWGGFNSSATIGGLTPDSIASEAMAFAISNGAQFLYSLLYLLLIYNITLISMEQEWGKWELERKKPRCTIVSGRPFQQSYFLQLPSHILFPMMAFSASMHWLLGQAISTIESTFVDIDNGIEHSQYFVTYAVYPIFISTILMIAMTTVCWWAFTYKREGFAPQMYGSIRVLCASTTELTDFGQTGLQWGDLGMGLRFRHAGFSTDETTKIVPAELYC
ncbi:hypothetical protein BP5796_04462 [Coleophoma crateriformis]|uniref:DUF6536 domain-containing protein n=1 Tax=Coleophoma crateriformis TaxID=565419 RepID=A0A3D8SA16_9HELO|nr:hypothetical protein BP5796_04462 [Coleophoma crateriformis]